MKKAELSKRRRRLWQLWRTAERLVRRMQRTEAMCPGSLYLLRRRCGKPTCRCQQGALHATWVVTRSEAGRVRLYRVPEPERAAVRRLTACYREWQRARAALVKSMRELLRQLDALAEGRLQPWPACAGTCPRPGRRAADRPASKAGRPAAEKEAADGPSRH
jgi:hypothetical protein